MKRVAAVMLFAACGGGGGGGDAGVDARDGRADVAWIQRVPNPDVDLLFVIDDSSSTQDHQTDLKNNFKALVDVMAAAPGGLPNLHLGVVSQDMGTSDMTGMTVSGIGGCIGTGKNGVLLGSSAVTGSFISDLRATGGGRTINYTGTLQDAFASIASLGSQGCGFEQPLHAAHDALAAGANPGFLRPNANLVIAVLMDEDDCSLSSSTLLGSDASLGALQSFRCTQFGVTCDQGGATPAEMAQPGEKVSCHSNDASSYLASIADFATYFGGLKTDRHSVGLAAIIGDPTPVTVELRTPPGGSSQVPALAHSCDSPSGAADPAVRIAELAGKFDRHVVGTICQQDQSPTLAKIGEMIDGMTGDTCLHEDIALPADCEAIDIRGASETPIPQCGVGPGGNSCFQIVENKALCPLGQHLMLDASLASQGMPDEVIRVRCKL